MYIHCHYSVLVLTQKKTKKYCYKKYSESNQKQLMVWLHVYVGLQGTLTASKQVQGPHIQQYHREHPV